MKKKAEPTPYYHKPPMLFKNFEIHYNRDYSLSHIQPNKHNYYEFYFLISGEVDFYINDYKYTVLPGDMVLIPPKQEHYSFIKKNNPYERYVLWLEPEYISSLSSTQTNLSVIFQKEHFGHPHISPEPEIKLLIHNLLESVYITSQSKEYGVDLLLNAYVIELLVNIAQSKLFSQTINIPMNTDFQKFSNPIIQKTLSYINEHIYQTIRIQDISDELFISKSHLSKIFSDEVNIPLHQFIIKKKLFLARQDLINGLSLNDIVNKYNFGNYSSFFRSFKSEFGKSPKQLQMKNKKNKPTIRNCDMHPIC